MMISERDFRMRCRGHAELLADRLIEVGRKDPERKKVFFEQLAAEMAVQAFPDVPEKVHVVVKGVIVALFNNLYDSPQCDSEVLLKDGWNDYVQELAAHLLLTIPAKVRPIQTGLLIVLAICVLLVIGTGGALFFGTIEVDTVSLTLGALMVGVVLWAVVHLSRHTQAEVDRGLEEVRAWCNKVEMAEAVSA